MGSELDDLLTGNDGKYRSISVPPGLLKEHHVLEAKSSRELECLGI